MSDRTPSWRERARPAEILGLAGVLALFVGLGVLMSTREWLLAVVFLGVAFVVSVVVIATLLLAISGGTPDRDDDADPH